GLFCKRRHSALFRPVRSENARHSPGPVTRFIALAAFASVCFCYGRASAGPLLVIDVPSGLVLYEERATEPWYPASVTKLMTAYVALSAVRDHRITFDTPIAVSARAASMAPSKMGFRPGTLVTLDNALKMLMVKSANDMAVAIAEAVSGSVEAFADDMNAAARALGMTQSHFVNPNGLPNPDHVSSARDLAILGRALYLSFPEQAELFNIGAMRLGGAIIRNHNDLLGRYPGVDGMKTGFICASGFNIVASATQSGRKVIAVVLGAPSPRSRAVMAAVLFDRAFAGIDRPSRPLAELSAAGQPALPSVQQTFCRNRGRLAAAFNAQTDRLLMPLLGPKSAANSNSKNLVLTTTANLARTAPVATRIAMVPAPAFDPVPVYVGPPPGFNGLVAQARPPHSPIGTPSPAGSMSAYSEAPAAALAQSPLAPDAEALPMKESGKTRRLKARRGASHRHIIARAAAKARSAKMAHSRPSAGKRRDSANASAKTPAKTAAKHAPGGRAPAKVAVRSNRTAGKTSEKHAKR
ncbi:MAG: D-alanyl-D-alanine carboxypeptidase, partial [Methylocapsa sp.]|nr:D-alanyl-D-alanine carboxypeptidase [Methylocapsa sp.]